jgi:hypothetical protein
VKNGFNTCLSCCRPVGTTAGGWHALCKYGCTAGLNRPYLSFHNQELWDARMARIEAVVEQRRAAAAASKALRRRQIGHP